VTVIAAIATADRVIMGCDTRTDYSGTGIMTAGAKISTLRAPNGDKVLLGAAGNASLRHVAVRGLGLGATPDPNDIAAANSWADELAVFIADGAAQANPAVVNSSTEHAAATLDGCLLLAWRHHLWWIFTHAAVSPFPGIMAIGSGTEVALGSLHTTAKFGFDPTFGIDPVEAVDLAVRLACRHAEGCGVDDRGPIIHSTVD
jgi:ATP-dependent protease HslVU (ClpYQ) peptidase subunit